MFEIACRLAIRTRKGHEKKTCGVFIDSSGLQIRGRSCYDDSLWTIARCMRHHCMFHHLNDGRTRQLSV